MKNIWIIVQIIGVHMHSTSMQICVQNFKFVTQIFEKLLT